MRRDSKAGGAAKLSHWHIIAELMKIDPPPAAGDDWLAGEKEGIYLAQCHLKGAAQVAGINGDHELGLVLAQAAVALNGLRNFDLGEDQL